MKPQALLLITSAFIVAIAMPMLGTYRTYFNQGENAISLMNESELALLEKIKLIRKGMSFREVRAIIGRPNHEGEYNNQDSPTVWFVNKSSYLHFNTVYVYFSKGNEVIKISWRNYGYFTYEPEL